MELLHIPELPVMGDGVKKDWIMIFLNTIITRLGEGNLQSEINKIDPHAVVIHQSINSIKGGIIKKKALH